MSQLLRQATTPNSKVPKATTSGTCVSPVAKLRDKTAWIAGTTPRLRTKRTGDTAEISTEYSTMIPSTKMMISQNSPETSNMEESKGTKGSEEKAEYYEQPKNISLSENMPDLSLIQPTKPELPSFLGREFSKSKSSTKSQHHATNTVQKDDVSLADMSKHSLSSKSKFDWDVFLSDQAFSKKLVSYVIPHLFRSQATKVFHLMDNVTCFSDLENNMEFMNPANIVDLFTSKTEFKQNIGGVVAITFLPKVISHCKNNLSLPPVRDQQLEHARSKMKEMLGSDEYWEAKSMYDKAMSKAVLAESTIEPLVNIQDLTASEQVTFLLDLERLAELYPGQDEDTQAHQAIKSKIIHARKCPHPSKKASKIKSHASVPDVITVETPKYYARRISGARWSETSPTRQSKH